MKIAKLSAGLALFVSAWTLNAAPLDRSQVAADATWFVHADLDLFKKTQLGQHLLEQLQKPDAQRKLDSFQALFNFDPTKALHGITLYGGVTKPEEGVLLIRGDFDTNRLVTLARNGGDYDSMPHGKYTIHSWVDGSKSGKPRTFGATANDTVIFGQKAALVADALDVISGDKVSMKKADPFTGLGISEKSAFLVGAIGKTGVFGSNPVAAILKHCKIIALGVSEDKGLVSIELPLKTSSEDTARLIGDINRGLVSLLAMQTDNANAIALARGLTVSQKESNVLSVLKLPVADVIQFIQDAQKKKANR